MKHPSRILHLAAVREGDILLSLIGCRCRLRVGSTFSAMLSTMAWSCGASRLSNQMLVTWRDRELQVRRRQPCFDEKPIYNQGIKLVVLDAVTAQHLYSASRGGVAIVKIYNAAKYFIQRRLIELCYP